MKDGFYAKKSVLGVPNALILLMLIFFCVPFGVRGARMALQRTENNVKDWLPSDFRETEELAWFAKRFVSEQFIVATWENCKEGDQRLKLFESKLRNEQAPGPEVDRASELYHAQQIGTEYALFINDSDDYNWGGKKEKWLSDENGKSYFITPNGRLYRWDGNPNIVSAAWRGLTRTIGSFQLEGQFVAQLGSPGSDENPNPFWKDTRLLAAPLFKSVETGTDMVETLAGEEGRPLFERSQPTAGRRDAIRRLTGTLFGPPVPTDFSWQHEELPNILSPAELAELPEGWESTWDAVIGRTVDESYAGDINKFRADDPVRQADAWYAFYDAIFVNEPPRQTCIVLTLTEPARRNLGRVIGRGMLGQPKGRLFELAEECGIASPPKPTTAPPPFSWLAANAPQATPMLHIGGPPVDNVAIDEEGTITLVRLIGYSLVLGLGLSFVLLRSIRLMMMVFFVGGVSAIASLGLVWWSNASIDAILLTMPSLVYVLGIAGAIHIVNYYRDAANEHGIEGAADRAIAHAFLPCTLAALTTAIGLLSLCSSNILPIRKFGIFSAMGVIATLALLYLYLPAALTIFPPKFKHIKNSADGKSGSILLFWEAVGRFILRRHWYVNAVCIIGFVGLGLGLLKTQTDVQLLKLFDSKSQIISDYAWLEKNFGRLVPMELVVRFPKELQSPAEVDDSFSNQDRALARTQLTLLERAEAVSKIQAILQKRFGYDGQNIVGRGMSATTFLRDIPEPTSGFDYARTGADRLLNKSLGELLTSDYMAIEDAPGAEGAELWRISLRLGALNNVDYGQFVTSLRTIVEPVVASYRCRHQVLDAVVNGRTDDRLVGRVIVLGAPKPTGGIDGLDDLEQLSEEEARLKIFSTSLKSCLTNQTIAEKNQSWVDPAAAAADSERFQQFLEARLPVADCVILLRDDPAFDLDFIKSKSASFVDATSLLAEIDAGAVHVQEPVARPVALATHDGEMDVVYTGVVPVVYKAQRTLLVSLFESVAWAFVLIAFVMACLLSPARSVWSAFKPRNVIQGIGCGAISMIPNVFPVVVIFGAMGHMGIKVDIGSMMTASVAMGVAVDDTIHFLTWFRSGLRKGLDRRDALFVAYKHVAPAMTQTTIIGGLGLSVFALSTFTPTQRFGTLMLALLGAALVGDLIFLPALLASPLGRIFSLRNKDKTSTKSDTKSQAHRQDDDTHPATAAPAASALVDDYQLAPEEPRGVAIPPPQMLRTDRSHVRRRT